MDDGDGMLIMELQAKQIAENATRYTGSHPCPTWVRTFVTSPVLEAHGKVVPFAFGGTVRDGVFILKGNGLWIGKVSRLK